ncbi:hypothetical protein CANARDRAFT_9023 [[Candida] arabinofermentans NRRL YB-2248]|uniref:NADH dehydrogenase [ubiquinone] 1 alpha subcomplex subunit n=1 Tax=[Candida] arabinofermentans NRRL YB-2248 TaxID=983967 RepID=A0A1E4SX11_9ASCO|nr:hypothetical protein CANARDRAFT_9023 [[Candida] arabinofermentans NRRL YB-2248]
MEELRGLVPLWKQAYYRWKSIKTVPFRKRFFIGYDLKGNTYWEFYTSSAQTKPRRIYQPHHPEQHTHDYFQHLPIQWLQWLRFTRYQAPTLQELRSEEERVSKLKRLVQLKELELGEKEEEVGRKLADGLNKELRKVQH